MRLTTVFSQSIKSVCLQLLIHVILSLTSILHTCVNAHTNRCVSTQSSLHPTTLSFRHSHQQTYLLITSTHAPTSFPSLPLSSPFPPSSSDPNAYSMSKVNLSVGHDPALRMQNLQLLVVRIKHFYLTYLQQLVISTLPNVSAICHSPDSGKLASL